LKTSNPYSGSTKILRSRIGDRAIAMNEPREHLDLIGRSLKVTNLEVSHSAIASFSESVEEKVDSSAPPTFGIFFSLRQIESLLQSTSLNWNRVVHGEQEFQIYKPITPGLRIACESTIEKVRETANNVLVTIHSELTSDGVLHSSCRSVSVFRR